MKKEELIKKIDLFLIIAIIFILAFIFLRPTITGFAVYTPSYYNWTFENPNDYNYNENLILIENNSAQLKLQETIYNWTASELFVESAYKDDLDETLQVTTLDNNFLKIKSNNMFNITFEHNLNNNDIINLYIKGLESNIYLCSASDFCSNNYSSIYFDGTEDYYNITIQNLPSPINTLAILNDNEVEFDYIKVTTEIEQIYYGTNYSYPEIASLETSNLVLPPTNNLNLFSKNQQLNQQQINYYYSIDNGLNYTSILEDGNLPVNLEQIKIKIKFNSDTTITPILYNMFLTHQYCTENWDCTSWTECINNSQIRTCLDFNECNSSNNKPIETQNCTLQETSETTSTSSGEGTGGSKTFTRPYEIPTTQTLPETETIITEETLIEEKKEPQEIIPEAPFEKIQQENTLQKFTGLVTYNIGEDGINIILLTVFIALSGLLIFRLKKPNEDFIDKL